MTRVDQLLQAVAAERRILILPHNDPDPDAIASAVALRHLLAEKLGMEADIAYTGIIGRAENRALVRYLGHPLRRLRAADLRQAHPIALVDTQPGAGNNPLPAEVSASVVFDHHPLREETTSAAFADVRTGVGATSTILSDYLQAAGIEPPTRLATALFYGIKTDTMGLVRNASAEDIQAYLYLQPRVDVEELVKIERAQVPREYFQRLAATLQGARIYDGVVVSFMGLMKRADMAAEMADLLLRLQGVRWVICTGVYKEDLILAVRTRNRRGGAGKLAQAVVKNQGAAGGHDMMAGGQIPLKGQEPRRVAWRVIRQALEHLQVPTDGGGQRLI